MPDVATARDEIYTLLQDEWDGDVVSSPLPLVYWDVSQDIPETASPWARATLQHFTGGQASLAGDVGQVKFQRDGTLTVQIFTPAGEGLSTADALVMIVMRAFEGRATPSGVWFRSVRINEVGINGSWFQTNVLADFTYDEVK